MRLQPDVVLAGGRTLSGHVAGIADERITGAVETYCPAIDGTSAARIEEEVIVTPKEAQVITLFPADELPIPNRY